MNVNIKKLNFLIDYESLFLLCIKKYLKMLRFIGRLFYGVKKAGLPTGPVRSMHDVYTRQQSMRPFVNHFNEQRKIIESIIMRNKDKKTCIQKLSKLYKIDKQYNKVYLSGFRANDYVKEFGVSRNNHLFQDFQDVKNQHPLIHRIVKTYHDDEETAKYLISQLFITSDNGRTRVMLNPVIVNHHYHYFMRKLDEPIEDGPPEKFFGSLPMTKYDSHQHSLILEKIYSENHHHLIQHMVFRYQHDFDKCCEILSRLYLKDEETGGKIYFTKEQIEFFYDAVALSYHKMYFSFQDQYLTIHEIVREYKTDKQMAIELLKELYYHDPSNVFNKIYMSDELAETYFNLYKF